MKSIEVDFYSEFDGDDGLILFSISDECHTKILIWEAFFVWIVERSELMEDEGLDELRRCYYETIIDIPEKGESYKQIHQVLFLEMTLVGLRNALRPTDTRTDVTYYDAENRIISAMIILISEAIEKNLNVYLKKLD
jgi:hypothetical protein